MTERRCLPHVARNRDPILAVLRRVLPPTGVVLEVASGSGEHAWYFSTRLPGLIWQPSDADEDSLRSIEAWRAHPPAPANMLPALRLDARSQVWGLESVDVVFNANMVHIAPWDVAVGLMRGAGHHLRPGGLLVMYGPYQVDGRHTSPSNERFDADLRGRDPAWGVRDVGALVDEAARNDMDLYERIAMPANNFVLVFRRR